MAIFPLSHNGGEEMEMEMEVGSAQRRLDFDGESSDSGSDSKSDSDPGVALTSSQEGRLSLFNHRMFQEWNRTSGCGGVDIPVLIMDLEGMRKNKDVDALPRFYMTQLRGSRGEERVIPFVFVDADADGSGSEGGRFVGLGECFHQLLGKKPKGSIPANKFRDILEKKPAFDSMMPFYEGVNIFLYSTFLLKQFAPIFGYIPQFYSPISDDAKYYFYIFFDYLRRKSIANGTILRKRTIVALVRDLGALNGLALSAHLIVERVNGIGYDLFHREGFTLLDSSEPFAFAI